MSQTTNQIGWMTITWIMSSAVQCACEYTADCRVLGTKRRESEREKGLIEKLISHHTPHQHDVRRPALITNNNPSFTAILKRPQFHACMDQRL